MTEPRLLFLYEGRLFVCGPGLMLRHVGTWEMVASEILFGAASGLYQLRRPDNVHLAPMADIVEIREGMYAADDDAHELLRQYAKGHVEIVLKCAPPGDSPIEKAFATAYRKLTSAYPQSQVQIGQYRVDFLLPNNVIVECDGHDYHASREQRTRDAKRDRDLMALGYKVVRFTGSEIHANADACARQAAALCK